MIESASPLSVALGAVGLAVAIIAGLFVLGWTWGRYTQWKMQYMPSIEWQYAEVLGQRSDRVRLWQKRSCLVSVVLISALALIAVTGYWPLLIPAILFLWALGAIMKGLEIMDTRCFLDNSMFRPLRLLTGEPARRRGRRMVILGLTLSVLMTICLISTLIQFLTR